MFPSTKGKGVNPLLFQAVFFLWRICWWSWLVNGQRGHTKAWEPLHPNAGFSLLCLKICKDLGQESDPREGGEPQVWDPDKGKSRLLQTGLRGTERLNIGIILFFLYLKAVSLYIFSSGGLLLSSYQEFLSEKRLNLFPFICFFCYGSYFLNILCVCWKAVYIYT